MCVCACALEPSQDDSDMWAGLGDAGMEDSLFTKPQPQSDVEDKEAGLDVQWLLADMSLSWQSQEGWPQGVGPTDRPAAGRGPMWPSP